MDTTASELIENVTQADPSSALEGLLQAGWGKLTVGRVLSALLLLLVCLEQHHAPGHVAQHVLDRQGHRQAKDSHQSDEAAYVDVQAPGHHQGRQQVQEGR
mgnify:CR=1 FL=1